MTGIVLAHTALGAPFVVITVTAALASFDCNLMRAAADLGATPVNAFFKVMLPVILPSVTSGVLILFGVGLLVTIQCLHHRSERQKAAAIAMAAQTRLRATRCESRSA